MTKLGAKVKKSKYLAVINPASGEIIQRISRLNFSQCREILQQSKAVQKIWAKKRVGSRIKLLKKCRRIILDNLDPICRLITQENGKTLFESMAQEVLLSLDFLDYFCTQAKNSLKDQELPLLRYKNRRSYIQYRPAGVHLAIGSWSHPWLTPLSMIVPPLLAGNSVILKPSSLTPLTAIKIMEIFLQAGLPENLFQVMVTSGEIASRLIDVGIDGLTFVGSTPVGRKVAAKCGTNLVPCSMELSGKNGAIVCQDADLPMVAKIITWAAFANAGQTSAAISRVYVHKSVYQRFTNMLLECVRKIRLGDPLEDGMSMGAITDPANMQLFTEAVEDARQKGGEILCGGKILPLAGTFFEPTIIDGANREMMVLQQELFGPILPLISYSDSKEAVEQMNESAYGLSAHIFTGNRQKGKKLAEQIEAANIIINEGYINLAMPDLPRGGIKDSGLGRIYTAEHLRQSCLKIHVNLENFYMPLPISSIAWQPYTHDRYNLLLKSARVLHQKGYLGKLKIFLGSQKR